MTLQPGQIINNRYRIVKLLGQGGFGAVYRAWDTNMRESVALKESLDTSPEAQNQFQTEARLLFKLRHTNLPVVHDFFILPNAGLYLVMDFVEGEDLETLLEKAARTSLPAWPSQLAPGLPAGQVMPWILQVCDALDYLHHQTPPVIHRDIKPANIRITPQGRAVLVDFGIAKLYDPQRRTTQGARAATAGYSPPEQYGAGFTNERSDIYALGATLYHLLGGSVPPSAMDVVAGQVAPPRPLSLVNPSISQGLSAAVMQALELDARNRPGSMAEFAARLKGSAVAPPPQVHLPPAAPPPSPAYAQPAQVIASVPRPAAASTPGSSTKSSRKPVIAIISASTAVFVLLMGFLGYAIWRSIQPSATPAPRAEEVVIDPTLIPRRSTLTPIPTRPPTRTPTLIPTLSIPVMAETAIPAPAASIALENLRQVKELARFGKGRLDQAVYSPNGSLLAVASALGVYLYDTASLEEVRFIPTNNWATSLDFSPDGELLAITGNNKTASLWRVNDGGLERELQGVNDYVGYIDYSPDGELIAASSGSNILVWRASDGQLLKTLQGHTDYIYDLSFSPDGSLLASGGYDKSVRLWRPVEGLLLRTLEGHTEYIETLAFSPDGQTLASGGYIGDNNYLRTWNVADGSLKQTFSDITANVYDLVYSPDGQNLAIGLSDKTVQVRDATSGSLRYTLTDLSNPVISLAFSPDSGTLEATSSDQSIRFWRASDGALMNTIKNHSSWVYSLAVSPDGQTIAAGGGDYKVYLRNARDGTLQKTLEGHTLAVRSLAFSPDGLLLASGSYDDDVRIWAVSDGALLRTFTEAAGNIYTVAFSPDGATLASASSDNKVRLYQVSDGSLIRTLEDAPEGLYSMAISPDGSYLASGSRDGKVRLYRLSDGLPLFTLEGHTSYVYSLAFSPDSQTLASGSLDNTVRLWRTGDGSLAQTLEGHSSAIYSVAFSPDGQFLASGSSDGSIELWRASDGGYLYTLNGHTTSVYTLIFTKGMEYILSGSSDGTIRYWGIYP